MVHLSMDRIAVLLFRFQHTGSQADSFADGGSGGGKSLCEGCACARASSSLVACSVCVALRQQASPQDSSCSGPLDASEVLRSLDKRTDRSRVVLLCDRAHKMVI